MPRLITTTPFSFSGAANWVSLNGTVSKRCGYGSTTRKPTITDALLLEGLNQADKAEEHYRAALRILPDYAEAQNNLAVLLHTNGNLAEAEAHYAAALRLRPQDPETNYNFALLAQAKGTPRPPPDTFGLLRS